MTLRRELALLALVLLGIVGSVALLANGYSLLAALLAGGCAYACKSVEERAG